MVGGWWEDGGWVGRGFSADWNSHAQRLLMASGRFALLLMTPRAMALEADLLAGCVYGT